MDRHAIERLAEIWKSRYPALAARIDRAIGMVDRVKPIGEQTWEVNGMADTYYVYANPAESNSTCTCPDSQGGHRCKHRIAVALVWKTSQRR